MNIDVLVYKIWFIKCMLCLHKISVLSEFSFGMILTLVYFPSYLACVYLLAGVVFCVFLPPHSDNSKADTSSSDSDTHPWGDFNGEPECHASRGSRITAACRLSDVCQNIPLNQLLLSSTPESVFSTRLNLHFLWLCLLKRHTIERTDFVLGLPAVEDNGYWYNNTALHLQIMEQKS